MNLSLSSTMVISFGIWYVIEDVGVVKKENTLEDYIINKERLWELYDWDGTPVYDWPVHLSEKSWMTEPMLADLFNALIFAQEYFAKERKSTLDDVSWAQTMYYSQHLQKMTQKFAKLEVGNVNITDVSNAFKLAGEVSDIAHLNIPK
jgi:hypothetical protein